VILAMYYKPTPDEAYESIRHITHDVTLGWLVRGMHRWGASDRGYVAVSSDGKLGQRVAEGSQWVEAKELAVWAIDAYRVAADNELGTRINTVMQPCFFALSKVLPTEEAIAAIKAWV